MKILLLEPYYKRDLPPLSFMKLSTKHKKKGDTIRYHRGDVSFLSFEPDIVYITSLFTWDYEAVKQTLISAIHKYPSSEIKIGGICASLMKDKLSNEVKGNYKIQFGIDNSFETENPDYDLFNLKCVIGFTTRGCCNKCAWCTAWRLEPEFKELEDWENCLKKRFLDEPIKVNKILLMDNNFLASSLKHIKKVTDRLKTYNRDIDFNQGLDVALFEGEKAKCFKGLKMHPLRFSWDNQRVDKVIIPNIKLAMNLGLRDIAIYCLYNFNDAPQEIYNRIKELAQVGSNIMIFLMKYQPLDTLKKGEYIGKYWNKETLYNFKEMRSKTFVSGILRFNDMRYFKDIFGKDEEDFLKKLNSEIDENIDDDEIHPSKREPKDKSKQINLSDFSN